VDLLAQPFLVQLGPDQHPGLVVNAHDQRPAAWAVGHAGHLVGQMVGGAGAGGGPRQQDAPGTAPARLLLQVDLLALDRRW
jgi:hypothetical protein